MFNNQNIRSQYCANNAVCSKTPNRPQNTNLLMSRLLQLNSANMLDIYFNNNLNDFRKTVETQSAKTQCKQIIGDCCQFAAIPNTYNFNDNTNSYCWICGFALENNATTHCDHIIPVLFACIFGGLHSNLTKKNNNYAFASSMYNHITLNYKYAHDKCNLSKSNILLYKWDDNKNKMIFDDDNGKILFDKIHKKLNNNVDEITYKTEFLHNLTNHIQPICDLINTEYDEFKKNKLNMTDYIKYTLNCVGLYFSKLNIDNNISVEEQREKMTKYLGNIKNVVDDNKTNGNVHIETGILLDIINDVELTVQPISNDSIVFDTNNFETPIKKQTAKRSSNTAVKKHNTHKTHDYVVSKHFMMTRKKKELLDSAVFTPESKQSHLRISSPNI